MAIFLRIKHMFLNNYFIYLHSKTKTIELMNNDQLKFKILYTVLVVLTLVTVVAWYFVLNDTNLI